jgi:hypothetical protein
MKKIIKLTESDLRNIIKRVISEQFDMDYYDVILDLYNESHNLRSKRKPKNFFLPNLKMFKKFNFINLVFILFFRRFKINSEFDNSLNVVIKF